MAFEAMTMEEEHELSKVIQKGLKFINKDNLKPADLKLKNDCIKAINTLVSYNQGLASKISNEYCKKNPNMDFSDLRQEALMGLFTAAKKYDYSYNTRFSTCAYYWAEQAVIRFIYNNHGQIHLPGYVIDKIKLINRTYNDLTYELNRIPTTKEVAELLNLTIYEVESLRELYKPCDSLDRQIQEDITLMDSISSDSKDVLADMEKDSKMAFIMERLKKYSERDRNIVLEYYGFGSKAKCSLEELGKKNNISRERVRQIRDDIIHDISREASQEYTNI